MTKMTENEVNNRIAKTWKKYWTLKHIMKGKYKNELKSAILNSCILPTLTYGAQTWAMTKKEKERIKTTQNAMERSMLGVRRRDRIKNTVIKKKFKNNTDFLEAVKKLKWDWTGHIARQTSERWTYKISFWYMTGKRKQGKQNTRWRDEIDKFLINKLHHRVAYDRREWKRLREAFARSG
jgi:hypothetical protein